MTRKNYLLVLSLLLLASSAVEGAFRFTAWSDCVPGVITGDEPLPGTNRARFQWTLQEMTRLLGGELLPDFHVVAGDFAETVTTGADVATFTPAFPSWYFAPGNHDATELEVANTSMDLFGARFVFVNQFHCPEHLCDCSAGRICQHICDWLANALVDAPAAVFVLGHKPLGSLSGTQQERDNFWKLLNDRAVTAFICGHTHSYDVYSDSTGPTCQINTASAGQSTSLTFLVFDVGEQTVDVSVYSGQEGQAFTGGYRFTMDIPVPIYAAHDPAPEDGGTNVPVSTQLSWLPGSGAIQHHVYLATTPEELALPTTMPVYVGPATSYDPDPDLDFETQYWWRVDEEDSAGNLEPGPNWNFTTGPEGMLVVAGGETSVGGLVSGSRLLTHSSDDAYEAITEVLNVPNKNGYSYLEHIWTFAVPPGSFIEFYIEAHRSASTDGDDFELSYSKDGYTYNHMLTVTSTYDIEQSFVLPDDTAGTVYIKATDTDRTRTNQGFDTLFIDSMCIVSSQIPIPKYKASNPNPADGATGVPTSAMLTWTVGDEATAHDVYFGTSPSGLILVSEGQAAAEYVPANLAEGTVYYWRVDEVRIDGTTETIEPGDVWSFTTYVDPGTPTTLTASVATSTLRVNPPNDFGRAVVTVTDDLGNRVAGATVTGHFTGDFSAEGSFTGPTDQDGQIVFTTTTEKKRPSFGFEVDSVTPPDLM